MAEAHVNGTTPLTIVAPSGEATHAVVVVQEAFGVNDHIEDVCRRFANEGFLAVAPHLYHRQGDPTTAYDAMSEALALMKSLEADDVLDDIDAALERLRSVGIDATHTGVVGFCMGGTVALVVGAQRDVGAVVTFYGGGVADGQFGLPSLLDIAPTLQAPWLGLYGDRDQGIPVEQVERLRGASSRAESPTELIRYPDAGHGFHCDQRASYHEESAVDAWKRTIAWLHEHLAA